MEGKTIDLKKQFNLFVRVVQYISSLTGSQDIWKEAGNITVKRLRADIVGFAWTGSNRRITTDYWTFSNKIPIEKILTAAVKKKIKEVLESGFFTTQGISIPEKYSLAFLPVKKENQTASVMIIGYRMAGEMPLELLDIYLGVAGIIGTMNTRRQAEKRQENLSALQHILRDVLKKNNKGQLLQTACDIFVKNHSFYNAWIALTDISGKFEKTYECGLGKDFIPMAKDLNQGKLPDCGARALSRSGIVAVKDTYNTCSECSLSDKYFDRSSMTARLEYTGKVYGFLVASVSRSSLSSKEERSLFKEIIEELSFALYNLDIGEKHKQSEKKLLNLSKFPSENPNPVIRIDNKGKVIFFNEAGKEKLKKLKLKIGKKAPKIFYDIIASLFKKKSTYSKTVNVRIENRFYEFIVSMIAGTDYVNLYGRDITDRKEAEEALKKVQQERKEIVTAERNRLERNLHDTLSQTLFSSSLIADVLPELWEKNKKEALKQTKEVGLLSKRALAEMRILVLDLSSAYFVQEDLARLIKQLVRSIKTSTGKR